MEEICCNLCWKEIGGSVVYITKCSHVFCREDTERLVSKDLVCPMCDMPLGARGSIHEVDLRSMERKTVGLCGVPPELILRIAEKAIGFWNYQVGVSVSAEMAKAQEAEEGARQREAGLSRQLVETQNKVNLLDNENSSLKEEMSRCLKDSSDLQEKLAEKVRQKRKLEELYQSTVRHQSSTNAPSIPSSSSSSSAPSSSSASNGSSMRPLDLRPMMATSEPGPYGRSIRQRTASNLKEEAISLATEDSSSSSSSVSSVSSVSSASSASSASSTTRGSRILFPGTPALRSDAARQFGGSLGGQKKAPATEELPRRAIDRFAALRAASPQMQGRAGSTRGEGGSPITRMTPTVSSSSSGSMAGKQQSAREHAESSFPIPMRPPTPMLRRVSYGSRPMH